VDGLLDDDQRRRLSTYHRDGDEWIARLPGLVREFVGRWRLELGEPFRPGGDASWAARVIRADGGPGVLKIALPDPVENVAVEMLRVLDGRGAVRLFEHDPDCHASLLELCSPGTFAAACPLDEADDAAVSVLPPVWALPAASLPALPALPRLSDVARQRAVRLRHRADQLDDDLLRDGADLYATLAEGDDAACVLHGDANQRNVLQSERGWLAIDPRPMVGDPCADLAMWITTRLDEVADPVERVTALAARLELPPTRALRWVAGQTMLLCSWLQHSGEPGPLETYRRAACDLTAASR